MGWKDKFTFRDRLVVEHKVGDETFRFSPNRIGLFRELRDLSAPVTEALTILFADKSRDSGSSVKSVNDGKDFFQEDCSTEPITVEMAKFRSTEQCEAIEKLVNTIADERNQILIGRLLMDSLRGDFPYARSRSTKDVEEFLYGTEDDDDWTGLDMPTMVELVIGWIKANAKVFGSSGEGLVGAFKAKMEALKISHLETDLSTSGKPSSEVSSSPSEPDSPLTS